MNAEKAKVLRISMHPFLIQIMVGKKQPESVVYFNYFVS